MQATFPAFLAAVSATDRADAQQRLALDTARYLESVGDLAYMLEALLALSLERRRQVFSLLPVARRDALLAQQANLLQPSADPDPVEALAEDFHKSAGIAHPVGNLRDATVGLLYRKRVFWLVLLVFGNLFSGAGIAAFEEVIAANIVLVFFLPLLVDSGGNAGAQSATLMVRALATGEVVMRDWLRLLGRECWVALALGCTMAVAVSTLGVIRGGWDVALIVASSMLVIVLVGSVIGMSLPFAFSRLRLDPATASGPLITSIADAAGVLVYFGIASWVLGL